MFPAMFQREWFELSRLGKVVRTTVYFSWRQSTSSHDKEISRLSSMIEIN